MSSPLQFVGAREQCNPLEAGSEPETEPLKNPSGLWVNALKEAVRIEILLITKRAESQENGA